MKSFYLVESGMTMNGIGKEWNTIYYASTIDKAKEYVEKQFPKNKRKKLKWIELKFGLRVDVDCEHSYTILEQKLDEDIQDHYEAN